PTRSRDWYGKHGTRPRSSWIRDPTTRYNGAVWNKCLTTRPNWNRGLGQYHLYCPCRSSRLNKEQGAVANCGKGLRWQHCSNPRKSACDRYPRSSVALGLVYNLRNDGDSGLRDSRIGCRRRVDDG